MNTQIIKLLETFEQYYTITLDKYRARAYNLAISAIRNYPEKITDIIQVHKIYGIGKGSIAEKIRRLLSGEPLDKIIPKGIISHTKLFAQLLKVQGFGMVKVRKLLREHKIKDFAHFIRLVKSGEIELTHEQLTGVKYYKDLTTPIEHSEMIKINEIFQHFAKLTDKKLSVIMVGSFRRKRPFSNDIDLLLSHPEIKTQRDLARGRYKTQLRDFYTLLKNAGIIIADLKTGSLIQGENGEKRLLSAEVIIKTKESPIAHKVDMKFYPMENFFTALVYFTGSKDFNEKLRRIAKRKGYKLSDFEMKRVSDNKKIPIKSEEDIFTALDQEYIPPEKR